jgi:hypothetical protein
LLRFLIILVLLSLSILAIVYLGDRHGFFITPSYSLEVILYIAGSTAGVYYLVQKKPEAILFTQTYLLSIVLKMLTGSIFILVIIFADRQHAFGNATLFLISYGLFTSVEIAFLYKTVNRQKPGSSPPPGQ